MNQLLRQPRIPGAAEAEAEAGAGAAANVEPEPERLARVLLGRLSEPGDAVVGRWLGQLPAVDVVKAIRGGTVPDHPALDATRLAGYQARLPGLDPQMDLKRVRDVGGRFIIPGDSDFCLQSPCCPRSCCGSGGTCCGRVAPVLGWAGRYN
ncbi:hypothetical protein ACGF0D_29565 [Kitasatospora sp. NPDC048298]|uniref:hypothetical protein n=1 Tax=Kitasatospora sp. NPDC048298 TaxID=3364049 RepID=UPI00371E80E7